jgi:hypothetical protein
MAETHTELAQFKARFSEQLRALRPRLYAADNHMREDVVRIEALRATLQAYDWSDAVRQQAAEYCGVEASANAMCRTIASAAYRGD